MAKIYALPEGMKVPDPDYSKPWTEIMAAEEKFLDELREVLRKRCPDKLVGAQVHTPRGDGHAVYMVAREKPLELVHVPIGDAWRADPVWERGLRLSDVKRMVVGRVGL
ncbi:MAG: hypothetical protein E6R03_05245 [Hyphomicrobiaceae bacterium]|nr:MAG: hypothetical protein E6R03_05245 [Hyphomicrobiaceae bacterium]